MKILFALAIGFANTLAAQTVSTSQPTSPSLSDGLFSPSAVPATELKLPALKDVFVVALYPGLWESGPYFTAESLKNALPTFKPITPHHLAGGRRACQSGVIVLKSKEVLFWSACYPGEIDIVTKGKRRTIFGVNGKWQPDL